MILHCLLAFHKYLCLSWDYVVVPATRDSPHETHEANLMRLRRNIKVNHYALIEKGAPVSVTPSSQSLEGPKFDILKQELCMSFSTIL